MLCVTSINLFKNYSKNMERYISFNLDDESDGDEEVGRLDCWTEILNSPIFLFQSFPIFLLSHIFMLNGNKI